MGRPSLFRPETFDLIAGEFATNLTYYRNYTDDDEIAGMFLGCALDIIDCTYYTFAKSLPEEQKKIVGFFVGGWNDDVFGTRLFDDIFNPHLSREVVGQHALLLDALRDRYEWLIRGPRSGCWSESTVSISEGRETCHAAPRCLSGEVPGSALARNCWDYYSAWRETMLAVDGSEELRQDPEALAAKIRERCRVLSLLTNPEGLACYLECCYGEGAPEAKERTVRGSITRLLTLLVDESLADLSRKMNLPPGELLYFAGPPA